GVAALDDSLCRLPEHRAGERPEGADAGPRTACVRAPRPAPDQPSSVVQGPAAAKDLLGSGSVMSIAEDLTKLSPKRLTKRREELYREALPCVSATVFEGNPRDGLTVGLWVE